MMTLSITATWLLIFLTAYVVGATPFGYMAGKMKGIDIRQHGSGNIGATNVIRVMGKGVGIPVFILDALKGYLPVLWATWLTNNNPNFTSHLQAGYIAQALAALGSIMGHNFTFWLGFRGGKGVATSAGAILGFAPYSLLFALLAWLIVFFTTRFVSLASMVAALVLPIVAISRGFIEHHQNWPKVILTCLICVLAIVRHRANIARLIAGTEPKAGQKKTVTEAAVEATHAEEEGK